MTNTRSHGFLYMILYAIVSTWLILFFVFPHIAGVTFTGGLLMALFVALVKLAIMFVLGCLLIIGAIFGGLALLVRAEVDPKKFSVRQVMGATFLKLGIWGSLACIPVTFILFNAICWKLTAGIFASLAFAGFLPAIYASAAQFLITAVPGIILTPRQYTPAGFRAEIEAEIAKAEAKMAASSIDETAPFEAEQKAADEARALERAQAEQAAAEELANGKPLEHLPEEATAPKPAADTSATEKPTVEKSETHDETAPKN